MGFASKDILANLNKKYSSRNPQYLMDGKRMIDEAVAKAEVDGAFLEEYCNLKKKLELDNQVLVIAVAILTGLAVSFSFDLLGSPATPLNIVVQITSFLVGWPLVVLYVSSKMGLYKRTLPKILPPPSDGRKAGQRCAPTYG